jgi:hypothetical protein
MCRGLTLTAEGNVIEVVRQALRRLVKRYTS